MSAAGNAHKPDLAAVRRFEAAGFRAWPAASVHYDGTWVIRLTANNPAKRLNSVNPLDPNDTVDLEGRIARAARRFEAHGRELTFRLSPFRARCWNGISISKAGAHFLESIVMRLPLDRCGDEGAVDHIPLKDIGRFTDAAAKVHGFDPELRLGLSELISRIQPEVGLFVLEANSRAGGDRDLRPRQGSRGIL